MRRLASHAARGAALAALLTGGACSLPTEAISPPEGTTLFVDGREVILRARYDPFQFAYYTEVIPLRGRMDAIPREEAIRIVEEEFGPQVCGGGPLAVSGGAWGVIAPAEAVHEYPTRGGWQILASCA